ncbi:MAG: hypothetical protein P8J27_03895 [Mariniblastus sp.]|nr:hypothetical protein [Mariniblastus sp.]
MNYFQNSIFTGFRLRLGSTCAILFAMGLVNLVGCGTTTTRTATEQLLMSDAVDNAISQIDFRVLQSRKVFIETTYLKPIKGAGFVNSDYIISSLRQQLTAAHCLIQESVETADVIVEPRVGALGTDGHEVVYGIPQSGSLASAAAAFSSSPLPPIPEISLGKSNAQTGIAKVIVFAYDSSSREAIWQSGVAKAESTSRNTWYFGAGPFQQGTIHEGTRFAGQEIPPPPTFEQITPESLAGKSKSGNKKSPAKFIPYGQPFVFKRLEKFDPKSAPSLLTSDDFKSGPVRTVSHDEELEND